MLCIYIYIYTHVHIHIYIYREREREVTSLPHSITSVIVCSCPLFFVIVCMCLFVIVSMIVCKSAIFSDTKTKMDSVKSNTDEHEQTSIKPVLLNPGLKTPNHDRTRAKRMLYQLSYGGNCDPWFRFISTKTNNLQIISWFVSTKNKACVFSLSFPWFLLRRLRRIMFPR